MKVSKELIERYHNGLCTAEESAIVENWLLDDDIMSDIPLIEGLDKEKTKSEMWDDISAILPSDAPETKIRRFSISRTSFTGVAAAASLLFILSVSFFLLRQHKEATPASTETVATNIKEIDSKDYTIALGTDSNAKVNATTGLIDFCGTILISPKKDIDLSFKDVCANPANNTGQMTFKKGATYIALNFKNNNNNEIVVMEEKMLMGLPPILKRQIMDQFNI